LLIFLSKELGYYLGSCPDEKLVRGLMEFCWGSEFFFNKYKKMVMSGINLYQTF
jgi:hypothetical protein